MREHKSPEITKACSSRRTKLGTFTAPNFSRHHRALKTEAMDTDVKEGGKRTNKENSDITK